MDSRKQMIYTSTIPSEEMFDVSTWLALLSVCLSVSLLTRYYAKLLNWRDSGILL